MEPKKFIYTQATINAPELLYSFYEPECNWCAADESAFNEYIILCVCVLGGWRIECDEFFPDHSQFLSSSNRPEKKIYRINSVLCLY